MSALSSKKTLIRPIVIYVLLQLLLATFWFGCNTTSNTARSIAKPKIDCPNNASALCVLPVYTNNVEQPLEVSASKSDAWIEGDILNIQVSYGGCGNRDSDFVIEWDGKLLESEPPLAKLYVRDTLTGATCDMEVGSVLAFNLKDIGVPKGCYISVNGSKLAYGL